MRSNVLWVVVALVVALPGSSGCEERGTTSTTTTPAPAPTTAPGVPGAAARTGAGTTRPATQLSDLDPYATTSPARDPNDPLATPVGAMTHLMDLMSKKDLDGVRAIAADAPPRNELAFEINAVAARLEQGATWAVVDSHERENAAMVLFRTTYKDGKEELAPLMFLNRYDRWKPILGQPNLRRWTSGEKDNMNKVLEWGAKRMTELQGGPATAPTTGATTAPAAAPAP